MTIFDKFFKSVFRPQDERISIFGKNKHYSVPLPLQNYFNTFLILGLSYFHVLSRQRECSRGLSVSSLPCTPNPRVAHGGGRGPRPFPGTGTGKGRRRTRYNWRAAPSLNAGLEGSRSVCCRAFTCAEGNLQISATQKSRAKGRQRGVEPRTVWSG